MVRDRIGVLKEDHLIPGQQVSIDHFLCSTKGRLFTSAGKSADTDHMYVSGCLFNDHASGYVHVEFQNHLTTHETLMSKENFELLCRDSGLIAQSYLSDNAKCFTAKEFTEQLSTFEQIVRFAGVGAHHHNGNAERSIQTIMSIARTMMLHSAIHLPDVADSTLWPMAVTHAVYLHNHMPNMDTGLSPIDLFTKSRWQQHKFHDLHVWGCPVYVLEKAIADGKKLPRWSPRSIRSMNMGLSDKHASTVPIVLNVTTGYITPQFHVVFDDWFSTVTTSVDNLPDFNSPEWAQVFGDSFYQYPFDEEDEASLIVESAANDLPTQHEHNTMDNVATAFDKQVAVTPLPVAPPATTVFPTTPLPVDRMQTTPISRPPIVPMSPTRERATNQNEVDSTSTNPSLIMRTPIPPQHLFPESPLLTPRPPTPSTLERPPPTREPMLPTREQVPMTQTREQVAQPPPPPAPAAAPPPRVVPAAPQHSSPRRSTRQRTAPTRLGYDDQQGRGYFVEPSAWIFPECGLLPPPLALKVTPSDPDTLTYDAAMSDTPDNVIKWSESAAKEITSLEKNETWTEVDMSDAKTRILPGTWVFRRKRTPDGEISKFKARYCVRGDLEEGEPETFAPVVAWSSVRLFLVLSLTLNWDTCSIDFSNAFVQAKLQEPVGIHLPRGFHSGNANTPKRCLRRNKSLYGLSIAPRLWFDHVLKAFTSQGFKQSQNDPCFLYKSTIMVVLYVDDVGIAYSDPKDLDTLLKKPDRERTCIHKRRNIYRLPWN
jgi:Reverse transcriptase (RNA-dependent DNA polymerase)